MKNLKKAAQKAKKIKLIATDIDGVLTDGKIIILESGEEIKEWDTCDRLAFTILRNHGKHLKIAWITGRKSKQVAARAREVGVHYLYQRCMNKLVAVKEIMNKENIKLDEVAFIGDDLLDLPVLSRCGFAVCPSNAVSEVKEAVDYIAKAAGGRGVFREVVELIFKSQGLWKTVIQHYSS
ncbi:MAG: 3-deoxy-D-manno-octulosonate 8-phosphate phosphatase KdsC [Elusimicrobia bacterium ADurb.Bin231]|nr:MAG: 3-deoxy-D-manno-octulosonate 8-phosphate phosphatase KdsC [Elusimicrobia bacterium ADurb.Bin231]